MLRPILSPCALRVVCPRLRCARAAAARRAPLAPRASAMEELAAVRREAAARHAAAVAAAAAVSAASVGAGGAGAAAGGAESDLALARRLQAEEDARAGRSDAARRERDADSDDDVIIVEPPAQRQRTGPAPSASALDTTGLGFQLTRCASVAPEHNVGAVSLRDIFPTGGLVPNFVLLSNYMYDMQWLLAACPALQAAPVVFMLTSSKESGGGQLARDHCRNFQVFEPPLAISFATHHSKFIFIAYEASVRICIHTANYLPQDWGDKTEGVWTQDFPRKAAGAGAPRSSAFEDDLVAYLHATKWPGGRLVDGSAAGPESLRAYDFSTARVALVASVPGTHAGNAFGHRRVKALLEREVFPARFAGAPMVWQFTSNGTVRAALIDEFALSFRAGRTTAGTLLGSGEVKIVWPTMEEVRRSYEGWQAGASIPGSRKNIRLPEIRALHHRWSAPNGGPGTCPEGRSRAMPHVKMFLRHNGAQLLWVVLGSHNLSGAAWGKLNNDGRLRIDSYELGVMFLPSLLPPGTQMACTAGAPAGLHNGVLGLRVPFSLPPARYGPSDEPWDWETPQSQPDSRGRTWRCE